MAKPDVKKLLAPYIAGPAGGKNGDHPMTCPLHEDSRRSATVNFPKGVWWCAKCGGGTISELIAEQSRWLEPVGPTYTGALGQPQTGRKFVLPTEARLDGYRSRLASDPVALKYLYDRGITEATIIQRGIGFNVGTGKYVVPIYNAAEELINVRYYNPNPEGKEPKWTNTPGFGSPGCLYPIDVITAHDELTWCEGEFDSFLTIQNGIPAFTYTNGAKITWQEEWNELLKGKRLFLCFDADNEGRNAVNRLRPYLQAIDCDFRVIKLPYKITPKNGKDISDWWNEGGTKDQFYNLALNVVERKAAHDRSKNLIPYDHMRKDGSVGRDVSVRATISQIEGPVLQMPKVIDGVCTMDWKPATCNLCPMGPKGKGGEGEFKVTATDDVHLNLLQKRNSTTESEFKRHIGIPLKCPVVQFDWESRAAWHGEIRNGSNLSSDAMPLLLFRARPPAMGETVELSGQVRINPRHESLFLAAKSNPVQTELERFELDAEQATAIRAFTDALPSDPREALDQIAFRLEDHVTGRFGLRWLHICADLVYHSVLSFDFNGERVARGWMELLAVGESRVGKSTAIAQLAQWYQKGEVVPCEKVSVPGLISTTEKRSGGRGDSWVSRIGKLPLLDRQLVIFDEAQGLKPEDIGKLSDARSSGIVKTTQAGVVEANARVRIIWLANPRKTNQRGVRALRALMGQTEDLARTDLQMFIPSGQMTDEDVERWDNSSARSSTPLDPAVMRNLMYWAWSRKPKDVVWHPGSRQRVIEIADVMSDKYASDIPLMPQYESRVRVARLAVAIAARLFSTDSTARKVRVLRKHVSAAGWVYANLLKNPHLEYLTEVEKRHTNLDAGRLHRGELISLVRESPIIATVLENDELHMRAVGQLFGSESQYLMGKLMTIHAIDHTGDGYVVNHWAKSTIQELSRR